MEAIEFLKLHRVYEDETIYNSVGEIVGTVSQLMEEYAALRQPLVSGSLPCHHNFIQKDTYWKSCTHCGMLAPLGQ